MTEPDKGMIGGLANVLKSLSIWNVLTLLLLCLILVPIWVIYRAVSDEKLMDRLLSQYEEITETSVGCILRHVRVRGGPDQWAIASGFAYQGGDRWYLSVITNSTNQPTQQEVAAYCESLKLITDSILAGRFNGSQQ